MRTGNEGSSTPAPSAETTSDWPFTPEVDTGGWQVSDGFDPNDGEPYYYLDTEFHPTPDEATISANVNLIAAAPLLYKIARKMKDSGFEWPELEVLEWINGWRDRQ